MLNQKKYLIFAAAMFAVLLLVGFSLYEKSTGTVPVKNNSESALPGNASDSFDVEIGTIYTCPMHPEVLQNYPGKCPKCKMKLEQAADQSVKIEGTVYTCTMHPEVRANYEGTCPVCKMKLEKLN